MSEIRDTPLLSSTAIRGTDTPGLERYEKLRDQGWQQLKRGCLEEAQGSFGAALVEAEALGSAQLLDMAYCNQSAVALRLQQPGPWVPRLQQILMRTDDPRVATLAAYNLALAYDLRKEHDKVLFYGRLAKSHAITSRQPEQQASALNVLGNAHRALGQFDVSVESYQEALELIGREPTIHRALILDNLGYSLLLEGELPDGFRTLFESLRTLRRCDARLFETGPRLSLSFAYLQVGRPIRALRHADQALEIAEKTHQQEDIKYALLLLGEGYKQVGDHPAARDCFHLLQEIYYPDMPQVPDMLLGLDVCKIIDIKA